MVQLGGRWLGSDDSAARTALPPEIIKRIEEQQAPANNFDVPTPFHEIEPTEPAEDAIDNPPAADASAQFEYEL